MVVKTPFPKCPRCKRALQPAHPWYSINLCRLLVLLPYIQAHPGLSTAELANSLGMAYADAVKAMDYARSHNMVAGDPEERRQGGIRYRYSALPGWEQQQPFATWEINNRTGQAL